MLTINFFSKKNNRILAQTLFWACLLGAMNLLFIGSQLPAFFLLRNLFVVVSAIILILLNTYYFVPKFFYNKHYGAYVLAVFVSMVAMVLWNAALESWMLDDMRMPPPGFNKMPNADLPKPPNLMINPRHFMGLVIYTAVVMVSTVLESVQLHRRQEYLASQIENEKLATELKFLKNQINPHFLFNVLNNVYTLSLIKSEQTAEVVMELSEMLRYMLYESNNERVPLAKEVKYIQNYISLQKLKDDEPYSVELDLQLSNPAAEIAPMLLIPFVENAFKHSRIEDKQQGWVKVSIIEQDNQLSFKVSNSLPNMEFTKDPTGGIGLTNVQRRLELEYPDRHQLDIQKMSQSFSIQLTMDLI
ncbi:MAG: hypothetical protein GC192_18165 [Bacteroidetes bacterium]|nr:hypothetical protein [Bacteroidota bacterium]